VNKSGPDEHQARVQFCTREQPGAVARGGRKLLLRQRVDLRIRAHVVAEERLETVDHAAPFRRP
jgi:hypothetical protein